MEKRPTRSGLIPLLVLTVTLADTGCLQMQQTVNPYTGQPQSSLILQPPPFLPGGVPGASGGFQLPRITINGRDFTFPTPGGIGYLPQQGQFPGWNQGNVPYSPGGAVVDPRTGQLVPGPATGGVPGYAPGQAPGYAPGYAPGTVPGSPGLVNGTPVASLPGGQPQFMPAAPRNTAPGASFTPAGTPGAPGSTATGPVAPSPGVATSLLGVQSNMDTLIAQQNQSWTTLQQNEQQTRANRLTQQTQAQNAKQGEITVLNQQLTTTTDATARQNITRQIETKNQELTTLRTAQQREIEQDTQTLTTNRTQLKQQQATAINAEITKLQTDMKAKQDEATRLRTLIADNQKKDQDLRTRITAKDTEMQQLTARYNSEEQTRTQGVTSQTTTLQTELRTLQTQLSTATEATRSGIQTQIDAKNKALNDLNTQSQQQYTAKYAAYQTEQQKITADGQKLRDELQALINTNAPLPQQLADADTLAQRLGQQVTAYQQRLTQVQAN